MSSRQSVSTVVPSLGTDGVRLDHVEAWPPSLHRYDSARSLRSRRYKISELMSFIAGRHSPVDSPSLPFCIRFNVSLQTRRRRKWRHVPYRDAAILDTEPVASSYSDGNPTRLSSNHFQSARASFCSRCFMEPSNSAWSIASGQSKPQLSLPRRLKF